MNVFKRKESRKHRSTPVASKQHRSLILKKSLEIEFVFVLLKTGLKRTTLWLNWLQNFTNPHFQQSAIFTFQEYIFF